MEPEHKELDTFVERLLTEKQFHNIEPEVRTQLKKDLMSRAEDYINAALLKELSESQATEFEKLLDTTSDATQLQSFLAAHIPALDQVIAAALIRFRNSYIGS